MLEISYDQIDGVRDLLSQAGFTNINFAQDFTKHDRFVRAQIILKNS